MRDWENLLRVISYAGLWGRQHGTFRFCYQVLSSVIKMVSFLKEQWIDLFVSAQIIQWICFSVVAMLLTGLYSSFQALGPRVQPKVSHDHRVLMTIPRAILNRKDLLELQTLKREHQWRVGRMISPVCTWIMNCQVAMSWHSQIGSMKFVIKNHCFVLRIVITT